MSNKTFKVIIILVCLLFLNIEAAQAGLVTKFKAFILHEFTDFQLFYLVTGILALGFFVYVLATPVIIGNGKSVWLDYSPGQAKPYRDKKDQVKRISAILKSPSGH